MLSRLRRSPLFYRYTALYFVVLLVVSGGFSIFMLRYAMNQLAESERRNALDHMTIMADDLEDQYRVLQEISLLISADPNYQPSFLATSAYKDIEILKSFPHFVNYSALSKQYFLMYPDQRRIFTSSGNSAYFEYYAPAQLGIDAADCGALREEILETNVSFIRQVGNQFLAVFPVRFFSNQDAEARAALCFMFTQGQIRERMSLVAAGKYDNLRVVLDGTEIIGFSGEAAADTLLSVASARERVYMDAVPHISLALLMYMQRPWIVATVLLGALLIVTLMAYLLSYWSLRPLWRLIGRYKPAISRADNEIEQLENIISRMEEINNYSLEQVRNTILVSILRGYYSEQLLAKWPVFHISFTRDLCCVLIISTALQSETDAWEIMRSLEGEEDVRYHLYAAHIAQDQNIVVLASFDASLSAADMADIIRRKLGRQDMLITPGDVFTSPKLLSISYMQALTARHYENELPLAGLSETEQMAKRLLALVRSRDEEGIAQQCRTISAMLREQIENIDELKQYMHALTAELVHSAMQQNIQSIGKQEMRVLRLLPDADSFANELCALLCGAAQKLPAQQAAQSSQRISRAIVEYVTANAFDPDFSLARISEQFGLSEDYVSAMIKKETGSAFKEYLTRLRIDEVKHLLITQPELTVNEISVRVGYRQASNLIRKFKELTGCTPTQYR